MGVCLVGKNFLDLRTFDCDKEKNIIQNIGNQYTMRNKVFSLNSTRNLC